MALSPQQVQIARLLEQLAGSRGLGPGRQREFAAASFAESGLNPQARNPSSGAAGLFQLLSAGYRQTAQRLGGLNNPRANALAILPEYVKYWRQHPGAAPGQAAAAVEASGEGAGFYARPLSQIPQLGGSVAATGPPPSPVARPRPAGFTAAPEDLRPQIGQALINQTGRAQPDYTGVLQLVRQQAQAHAQQLAEGVQADPAVARAGVAPGAAKLIQLAKRYIGTPYKWGGTSPKTGFDCSGFVQYLYSHAGIHLPRTSQQQWRAGRPVAKAQLRPGDLVFFEPGPNGPGHEGLFIGNGQFIESPHTGASIRISRLAGRSDYAGARRVG